MTALAPYRPHWRLLAHTADVGLRLYGPTPADIFRQAALGLYSLMTDRRRLRAALTREATVTAPDQETLLVAWLNHLLYLYDAEGFLGKEVEIVELTPTNLRARLRGELFDPERHPQKTGIKAATYHQLSLQATPQGWQATVILDL